MNRNEVIENFYKTNYKHFCKSLARPAGGYDNAEDVVQEAFYRALKYWDSYTPGKYKLYNWFSTILNRCLKDFMRAERNSGMSLEAEEEVVDGSESIVLNEESSIDIINEISSKPRPVRDILYLYYMREYTPKEIEQTLGTPNKSIRMAIWRFKRKMGVKFWMN